MIFATLYSYIRTYLSVRNALVNAEQKISSAKKYDPTAANDKAAVAVSHHLKLTCRQCVYAIRTTCAAIIVIRMMLISTFICNKPC